MSSTSTIDFNEAAGNALERAFATSDVIDQRAAVLRALDLIPDEHVLDLGPGPGLLLREMAEPVGAGGRAVGVDLSEPMLRMARRRCAELACVEFDVADAARNGVSMPRSELGCHIDT